MKKKYESNLFKKSQEILEKEINELLKIKPDDKVIHDRFGMGIVKSLSIPKDKFKTTIQVEFEGIGTKKMLLRFCNFKKYR